MPFPPCLRLPSLILALSAVLPAWGQSQATARFLSAAPEPGWSLGGSAALTAPSVDADGAGWLRLTGNANNALGYALHTSGNYRADNGLTVTFSYVSWGGGSPGADGIAVFLYDASANMTGAIPWPTR